MHCVRQVVKTPTTIFNNPVYILLQCCKIWLTRAKKTNNIKTDNMRNERCDDDNDDNDDDDSNNNNNNNTFSVLLYSLVPDNLMPQFRLRKLLPE